MSMREKIVAWLQMRTGLIVIKTAVLQDLQAEASHAAGVIEHAKRQVADMEKELASCRELADTMRKQLTIRYDALKTLDTIGVATVTTVCNVNSAHAFRLDNPKMGPSARKKNTATIQEGLAQLSLHIADMRLAINKGLEIKG